MINHAGNGRPPSDDDPEETMPGAGDSATDADAASALARAEDPEVLALGTAVLAELMDRGLLRVLLRNRIDAATAFEIDSIRGGGDGLDLVVAGFHAETPEDYADWVREAAALGARLGTPSLSEEAAEAALGEASDEALLLTLESARMTEDGEEEEDDLPPADSAAGSVGARVAIELLRRGVIEAGEES